MKTHRIGSISHGTLRTEDLLSSFSSCLEGLIAINGEWLSQPENFPTRDRLAKLLGEAQDAYNEDGETLQDEEAAAELVNDLQDALNEFAPAYATFGTHPGDGSEFGFWVDVDSAKESCEFVSSKRQESPDADFRGEWLSISDHGNATLYVREDAANSDGFKDSEIWGIV